MARRTFVDDLDLFAYHIALMAESIGRIERWQRADRDNPIYYIAFEGGQLFLDTAQAQSPVWTGLLQSAHLQSGVEIDDTGSGAEASTMVFINPDPSLEHSIVKGTWPGQYGPEYHDETRQWFGEAEHIAEPGFHDIVDTHFHNLLLKSVFDV